MKNSRSDKTSYILRIGAGVYLIYTDYSILSDWESVKPNSRIYMLIAVVVFAIIAILLLMTSIISLLRLSKHKRHADSSQTPDSTTDEGNVEIKDQNLQDQVEDGTQVEDGNHIEDDSQVEDDTHK